MGTNLVPDQDLIDNPTSRVAVCLCLDLSGTMNIIIPGTGRATSEERFVDGQRLYVAEGGVSRLDELKKGIQGFYEAVRTDTRARDAVELSIVTFGKGGAQVARDFSSIDRQTVPDLTADGETPMGEAVNLALDLLDQRKKKYREKGIDYYQPWLVVMTDGVPNGDPQELERAIGRTENLVNEGRLTVFPIGICEDADFDTLRRFRPDHLAVKLKNTNFQGFFAWLSKSAQAFSASKPGQSIDLPHDEKDLVTWFQLENKPSKKPH